MKAAASSAPEREKSFLGACLLNRDACEHLVDVMAVEDFVVPRHRRIAEAVAGLHGLGLAVDAVTVAGWIVDHHGQEALADGGGTAYLGSLVADAPSSRNGATYAVTVKDRANRRRLWEIHTTGLARLDDTSTPVDVLVEDSRLALEDVDFPVGHARPPTLRELMARRRPRDWLITNLLVRTERVMITSSESGGKSEMLWQIAVQATAGIHPFARLTFDPLTVLVVDRENTEDQLQTRWPRLVAAVARTQSDYQPGLGEAVPLVWDPDRLFGEVEESWLDLTKRPGQRWLSGRIDACRPDLVIIGPVYKLMPETRDASKMDENIMRVCQYIDRLRARYRCAFILEAHTPLERDSQGKRILRPKYGQSWMAWLDFGYGFRPRDREDDRPPTWEGEIWKGRDATRVWPDRLQHGEAWPWINSAMAHYEDPPF